MNKAQKIPMLHKVLSMILALVMVLSLLPVSALAETTDAANSTDEFMRIFHLDCGRKYFSVSEIEGMIDQLAANHYTHIQLAFGNDGFRFLLKNMELEVDGKTYSDEKVRSALTSGNETYSQNNNTAATILSEADMDDIITHAEEKGIKVIPMFNAPYHINAVLSAMETLGLSNVRKTYDSNSNYLNLESDTAVNFVKALQNKYITYFAGKHCKYYNFAADEYHFASLDNSLYTKFATFVNDLATMIDEAGMTPMAYNDGFYYGTLTSSVKFDTDILICYWAEDNGRASAKTLADKGFKIINNSNAWYYVLGDALYEHWGSGQWGYDDALNGINTTKVTQVKGDTTGEVNPIGSVLCVWCDFPEVKYTGNSYTGKGHTVSVAKNNECISSLIKAMADANPEYFTEMVNLPAEDASSNASVIVRGHKGETASVTVTQIESAYKDQFTAENSVSYEITPKVEGEAYTGEGTVTLPVPEEWAQEASRIRAYIVTDGEVQTITGTLADGKYTFKVPHFSEMGLLQVEAPTYETVDISIPVGGTVTRTVDGSVSIVTDPDSSVATADVTTVAAGKTLTQISSVDEIKSGAQYVIYNERYGGYLTSATVTDQGHTSLGLNQVDKSKLDESSVMWTITQREGSKQFDITYDNEYLNVPQNNKAEISSTKPTNAFSITPATNGEMLWTVSQNGYYLNNLGEGKAVGGWNGTGASTDKGSQWYIFRVDETTEQTKITFTAVENAKVGDKTTAVIGDKQYNITIVEKKQVEIPITIVDYRADGLLFDFQVGGESYDYGLVHSYYDTSKSGVNGGTLSGTSYGTKIEGTTLENTGYDSNVAYSGDYYTWGNKWSRSGMVEQQLGSNGMPVYTDATVKRVAQELAAGNYNQDLNGDNTNRDVKSALEKVTGKDSTAMSVAFAASKTWNNINNAYDLAWYLLNTIYQADTNMTTVTGTDGKEYSVPIYGMKVDAYDSIILTENSDGSYSFDAANNITKYDTEAKSIYEDSTVTSDQFYPLEGLGYDAILGDTTDNESGRNGSFTLRGEAQFVYNDDLYFTFSGDDDVYMYVNGTLVLDLGGAHGVCTKTVNLKDVADKCGLEEGKVATFTFFYMERNSSASNFKIETNMELVKRDIDVQKLAYSDTSYSAQLSDGSVVNNGNTIAYDLVVTNNGNSTMNNISFSDEDTFGGLASFGYGVGNASVTKGNSTDAGVVILGESSYTIFVTDANGNAVADSQKTLNSLSELSSAVADITLEAGQSLHVRFLTAKTDVKSSKMLSYTNTVTVTANSGGSTLSDSASHTIYSYNANDTDKTYVVDFGLPVKIENIFEDSSKDYIKEVKSVKQQPTYGKEITPQGSGFYTYFNYELKPNTTIDGLDTIKLSVDYDFSSNIVNLDKTINIIPASTVYYEDSFASFTSGDGAAEDATWSIVNDSDKTITESEVKSENQALEALGAEGTNVYGYDQAYADSTKYSMGSAHKVTVTADMATNWTNDSAWPTATFTFKGTGFDIISLTDNTSGTIFVDVYKGNKATGDAVKSYFVDNYYGYKLEDGKWVVDKNSTDALYQIPVMKVTGLDYDTYTVTIRLAYSEWFDHTDAQSYTFVLDAIRVYDPMVVNGNSYYTQDNEGYPQYIELRDGLVEGTADSKMLFIDGGSTAEIKDYENYGPNNEVYLADGQAISFKIPANSNIASIQIGAKAPSGTANLVVNNNTVVNDGLVTATEMYYDITSYANDGNTVTISNTGDGILSLTNLKITYSDDPGDDTVSLEKLSSEEQTQAVMAVRALFASPVVEPFAPERFEAEWNSVRAGRQATLTVKTSTDVEAISVNGVTVDSYKTRSERSGWGWWAQKVEYREFSYTVKATETADYDVCAVNADGLASDPITATLTVKPTQNSWWNNWWNGIFDKWF